jgi:hypothetical protein
MTHVESDIAIAAMTTLWRSYGNEISSPLLATWRTMCDELNRTGQVDSSVGWTALAMPTGAGKTLFTSLYCALLPNPTLDLNSLRAGALHPGVLFVTRFTKEADKFAEQVNKLADRNVAAAYHSSSTMSLAQATRFPVLAITHAACERHQLTKAPGDCEAVWDQIVSWHQSRRAKIIIDETPSFITSVQINSNWIAQTLGALTHLPDTDPKLYFDLQVLLSLITDKRTAHTNRALWPGEFELIANIDTAKIRDHLSTVNEYAMTIAYEDTKISLRKACLGTLSAIEAIQANGWGWVSFRGDTAQINSAMLHPSLRDGSGIILDGTATLHTGYSLLSPSVKVIGPSTDVRNYENVTLHVARGHNAGKGYLAKNASKLWTKYRDAMENELANDERVLVCSHKEFRDQIDVGPLPRISFAHYGDIDGRNDWESYEAVAILGLAYLDGATPGNIAQAILGAQTTEWLQTPSARQTSEHGDLLTALHRSHLSVSAVQAISRVRLRNAIDSAGRCKTTTVFIALPYDADGDAVLSAIVKSMPKVRVVHWKVDVAKRKRRIVPACEALVHFFTTAPAGVYTKAEIRSVASIAPSSLDRTIKRLGCATSNERMRLDNLRVTYYAQYGKGAQSYFVKA